MKIYVGHSTSYNFKKRLYKPLKNGLADEHDLVFPHEDSKEIFDSKSFLRDECDVFIAEVSEASTGLGIELGWADSFDVQVICIYRKDSNPSSSIKAVDPDIIAYEDSEEMVELLKKNF